MATFNSVGDSLLVYTTPGDVVTYTLDDTGGTFAGTIKLMRSDNTNSGWVDITSITDGDQDGTWTNNVGKPQHVKLLVTAYSGDATTATLVLTHDEEGAARIRGDQVVDQSGNVLFDFNDQASASSSSTNNEILVSPSGSAYTDRVNIQTAINSAIAGGGIVRLAAGTFSVDQEIAITWNDSASPGFVLKGAGALQTKIYNEISGGGYIFSLTPESSYKFNNFSHISDVGLYGPQTITNAEHGGILITAVNDFQMKRIYFKDLGNFGIKSGVLIESGLTDPSQTVRFTLEQMYFSFVGDLYGGYGIHLGTGATTGGKLSGIAMNHCGGGIYQKCFSGTYDNCSFNYCRHNPALKFPYAAGASSRAPIVHSCYFEGNHAGDVDIYSCNLGEFKGNNHNTNLPDNAITSLTESGGTMTMVVPNNSGGNAPFKNAYYVTGRDITLQNCSNAANDGTYTVTYVDGNTVTFSNGSGVTEADCPGTFTLPVIEHFAYKLGRDYVTDTVTSLTFDAATNLVTLVSPSSHFTNRDLYCDIEISGATNGDNDGLYNIEEIVSATSVKYRNPDGVTEGAVATYEFGVSAAIGRVGSGVRIEGNVFNSNGDIASVYYHWITQSCEGTQVINPQYQGTTNATTMTDYGVATDYREYEGYLYGPIKKEKLNTNQNATYTCDLSLGSKFRVDIEHQNAVASITQAASVNTIVMDSSIFTSDNVNGKTVYIDGATNSANDGAYTATYVNGTTITVPNASGVTEGTSPAVLMFAELEFKIPTNGPLSKYQDRELEIELLNPGPRTLNLAWETGAGGFFTNNRNVDKLPSGERFWAQFKYDDQSDAWVKAYPYDTDYRKPAFGTLQRRSAGTSMSLTTSLQVLNGTWDTQGSSGMTVASPCKITNDTGETKKFHVSGYVQFRNPATTARYLVVNLLLNGSAAEDTDKLLTYYTATTTEYISFPINWVVSLDDGDYIELAARVLASTLTIDCYGGSMQVREIEE